MELGEPDASGRRRPTPIAGSEFVIDCEMVVVAIGTRSNPLLTASEPDLALNKDGYIVTDEHGMSSLPGVFAGGDIVRGAATVILAMGDGKRAAASVDAGCAGSTARVEAEPTVQSPMPPHGPPRTEYHAPGSRAGSAAARASRRCVRAAAAAGAGPPRSGYRPCGRARPAGR